MASIVTNLLGGGLLSGVSQLITTIRGKSPEDAAKLAELAQKYQSDILAADQATMQAQADVIKTEAQSQSWLPRNVRPLLLLLWGSAITVNVVTAVIGRLWNVNIVPVQLDPWVYKLTAIGFTGYVGARSVEKYFDKAS